MKNLTPQQFRCGKISRRAFATSAFAAWGTFAIRHALAADAADIPDYWKASLDRVVERIAALRARGAGEASFFFTDVHNAASGMNSGRLIGELVTRTNCRRAFCGGDIPCAYGGTTFKATLDLALENYRRHWVDPILDRGGLLVSAKGNHDFTIRQSADVVAGYTYADSAACAFLTQSHRQPFTVSNPDDPIACYCYRDVPAERLRLIVVDSTDRANANPDTPWGVVYGLHQPQLEWLADVAFATIPDGWSAIVMQHIPCAPIVESGGITSSLVQLRQLMEAYQNRGKITLFGKVRDYSTATGRILINLTGHHHADRWTFLNGIHHLTIACDAVYGDMIHNSPFCNSASFVRTRGTEHEHAFDAIQWSAAEDVVFATRVGEGQNRALHISPRTITPGDSFRFESTLLEGPVTWAAYDGDTFTYNNNATTVDTRWSFNNAHGTITADGIFRAGTPGSVVVLALDANFNKEIFGVTVS